MKVVFYTQLAPSSLLLLYHLLKEARLAHTENKHCQNAADQHIYKLWSSVAA